MQEIINETNNLIYKCLHYFVVEMNYEVVIVKGLENEIWLQNFEEEYKIVRLVFNKIINKEQLDIDLYRSSKVANKIKTKTFSLKMKVMSFYFNIKEDLELPERKNNILVKAMKEEDITLNESVLEFFPNIKKKLTFEEEGIELFLKINSDIEEKNARSNKEYARIFKPKVPYITYSLIFINILIFIAGIIIDNIYGQTQTLQLMLSTQRELVYLKHQFYRVITSEFIHLDFVHLLLNMFVLYNVGRKCENHLGKFKYLSIYLISGISGALLSMAFHNTYSLGASGSIFGILGALLYFGYYYRAYLSQMLAVEIIPAILLNLSLGFFAKGVDNFAHIGGLIGGVAIIMALGVKDRSSKIDRINGIIITAIILGFFVFLGLKSVEII